MIGIMATCLNAKTPFSEEQEKCALLLSMVVEYLVPIK